MKRCKNCMNYNQLKIGNKVGCPFQKICEEEPFFMYNRKEMTLKQTLLTPIAWVVWKITRVIDWAWGEGE